MEILSQEEFWKRNPAPGTKFVELDGMFNVIANPLDPETEDPDDITLFTESRDKSLKNQIGVVSWGSWDNHQELLAIHDRGVESIKSEDENYIHKCALGLPEKS
jgi:hypothetical protein